MTFDDFGMELVITGKPLAQKRPRFARRGKYTMAYNPQESEAGMFATRLMAQVRQVDPAWGPVHGAVELDLVFEMPIPASTSQKKTALMIEGQIRHTKKPDLDNLVKFVKDCGSGILWQNDSQIDKLKACKEYSRDPGTHIRMRWAGKGESDGR